MPRYSLLRLLMDLNRVMLLEDCSRQVRNETLSVKENFCVAL